MGTSWGIIVGLFLGGVLAAASLIIKRKPDAKELIDKIAPYQGYIGLCLFGWGLWNLRVLKYMGLLLKHMPVSAIVIIVAVATMIILGFMLGFGLITKYALSKNETAMAKGQALRAKLAPIQGTLGLVAIAVSIALVVLNFVKL